MAQVESLTGIKAHTLRIWERRYNFLNPMRTDTNIRYYSDDELRKLLNFGILIKNGYRVSKLDKMSEPEIHTAIEGILENPEAASEDEIKALTISMLDMNEAEFEKVYQRFVLRKGLLQTVIELIYPFLHHVGILWGTGKAIPAQEHFVSNLVRQKIISSIDALPMPDNRAKKVLFFLLEGEDHEIGLLLAYFIAKDLGWKCYYLGQNVPVDNMQQSLDIIDPDILLTMFVAPRKTKTENLVKQLRTITDLPILMSGNPDNFMSMLGDEKIIQIEDPDHFVSYLEEF